MENTDLMHDLMCTYDQREKLEKLDLEQKEVNDDVIYFTKIMQRKFLQRFSSDNEKLLFEENTIMNLLDKYAMDEIKQ